MHISVHFGSQEVETCRSGDYVWIVCRAVCAVFDIPSVGDDAGDGNIIAWYGKSIVAVGVFGERFAFCVCVA